MAVALRCRAPNSSSANRAWNAFSNCRASAIFNEFLAARIRRAQMAAVLTESISLSSPRSWSRSPADNWPFRPASEDSTSSFAARLAGTFRRKYFWPLFGRVPPPDLNAPAAADARGKRPLLNRTYSSNAAGDYLLASGIALRIARSTA